VSERQLVVRFLNGAVSVREAQGARAQDRVQESEKERPDDSLREPGVRHALAADVGRARSRAAGHPHAPLPPQQGTPPAAGAERMLFPLYGAIKQQTSKQPPCHCYHCYYHTPMPGPLYSQPARYACCQALDSSCCFASSSHPLATNRVGWWQG
jgi:hypothetical protein